MAYFLLTLSIVTDVAATVFLKASNGWQNLWFGAASIFFFAVSGFVLGFAIKGMSVGLTYTLWSGVGIALACIASVLIWQQKFDLYALAGITLIFLGTVLITAKSNIVLA